MTTLAPPEPASRTTDDHLLAAAAGGDRSALGELVRRHVDLVYAVARRQTADPHRAEDVTQAVFLVLARKAGSVRGPALPAWLHRTARYAAANANRAARRRRQRERAAARPEAAMPSEDPNPLLPLLDDAIASLGSKDRAVVIDRYLLGHDLASVAERIGATPQAAQKRLERAVAQLRRRLSAKSAGTESVATLAGVLQAAGPAPAPASLPVLTPSAAAVATAQGVLSMLIRTKLKLTAAVALVGGVIGGGLAAALVFAVGPASPPRSAPATAPANQRFIGRLRDGAVVELLGVSESPSADRPWWRADGSPLADSPYQTLSGGGIAKPPPSPSVAREFAYGVRYTTEQPWVRCVMPTAQCAYEDIGLNAAGAGRSGLFGMAAVMPDGPAVIHFDLAAGRWHTDLTAPGTGNAGGDIPGGVRRIGPARASADGGTEVDVTLANASLTVGEIRLTGKRVDGPGYYGGSVLKAACSDTASTDRTLQETFHFPASPDQIMSIQLESRPYDQWIEFRNVSVHPGQPTTVTMATSDNTPVSAGPYPKLAPFTDLRWNGPLAEILIGGTWYTWVGLGGRSVADLAADAQAVDHRLWQKRLSEDLVEVLDRTGHPPGDTVTLWVRPIGAFAPVTTLDRVPMTEGNRRSVLGHRRARGEN